MNNLVNFLQKTDLSKFFIFLLIITTIVIMAINFQIYDPIYGYDAEAHYNYIDFFSMYLPDTIKIPTSEDTREFFSPPLPYVFPSSVIVVCRNLIESTNYVEDCRPYMSKISQLFQIALFFLSLFFYTKIAKLLYPKSREATFVILLLILIQTVNYRTFLMIRGEPYIIFFQSLLLYFFCKKFINLERFDLKDSLIVGILIGFLGLSKQWAFLLFPSYFFILFFLKTKKSKKEFFKFITVAFLIAFILCGWFYINLLFNEGSPIAFNHPSKSFDLRNQPLDFYFSFEANLKLFTNPIRPNFDNQLFPIIYSDLWGDYWGYFTFVLSGWDFGRNQETIGSYLGRINLLSLIPTYIYLFGFFISFKLLNKKNRNQNDIFKILIQLGVVFTFIGYLWFTIRYPAKPSGDSIKATYMIQLFHLIAFLGLDVLERFKNKSYQRYILFIASMIIVYFHNLPAMITHYL